MYEKILKHLEYYISLGLCVIPAYPSSKQPCVAWKEYQERKPTPDEIEEWKKLYWSKGYNIGCISGSVSGNHAIIDIDNETLAKKFKLEKFLEKTMVTLTGSGKYHIHLRTPEPVKTVKFLDKDGKVKVEVRGEGAFTILAPSIHPETKREYKLLSAPDELVTIKDLISSLSGILGLDPVYDLPVQPKNGNIMVKTPIGYTPPCFKKLINSIIPEGWRNEALIRVTSYYYQKGYGEEELYSLASKWNLEHCDPPLDLSEVYSVVRSVIRHGYIYRCNGLKPVCTKEYRSKCKLYNGLKKKLLEVTREVKLTND